MFGQRSEQTSFVLDPPIKLGLFQDVGRDEMVEQVLLYRPPAILIGQIAHQRQGDYRQQQEERREFSG